MMSNGRHSRVVKITTGSSRFFLKKHNMIMPLQHLLVNTASRAQIISAVRMHLGNTTAREHAPPVSLAIDEIAN